MLLTVWLWPKWSEEGSRLAISSAQCWSPDTKMTADALPLLMARWARPSSRSRSPGISAQLSYAVPAQSSSSPAARIESWKVVLWPPE